MKCSLYGLAGGLSLTALAMGCASPGPPRAPSLRLPAVVTTLHAERSGGSVLLRFAAPVRTTDDEPVSGTVTASLCRGVGGGPCGPTSSIGARTPISGQVEWVDVLPPELAAGPAKKLTYRVETFNERGRSAGPSPPVAAPAGDAPAPVRNFRAQGSRRGVELRWDDGPRDGAEILVRRELLDRDGQVTQPVTQANRGGAEAGGKGLNGRRARRVTAKASIGAGPAGKLEDAVWLQADKSDKAGGQAGGSGLVDTEAKADQPYRYTAVRRRIVALNGEKLELRSEMSVPATITLHDVYPPEVPLGLLAVSFPLPGGDAIAVDLAWQPVTDSSLAGYNVYRQTDGGPAVRLTAAPVGLPSFHDATPVRGVSYRYAVTAVDRKGNESGASAGADVAATP